MTKSRVRLSFLMSAEFMGSVSGCFMTYGVFFYTKECLGWNLLHNCLLGASQGFVYVFAAMAAHAIQQKFGRLVALRANYLAMILLGVLVWIFGNSIATILSVLLYSFFSGASWPMLESLVSGSSSGQKLARRLGFYNIVWSVAGAAMMFVVGYVMKQSPPMAWALVAMCHFVGLVLLCCGNWEHDPEPPSESKLQVSDKLITQRRLAMHLSRISLPATYVVMNGLAAMLPSLALLHSYSLTLQTVIGSCWMLSRVLAFVILASTVFWQSKPRLLLWACMLMFVSFLLMVIPAARASSTLVLCNFLFWQIGLGLAIGYIYAASLYFGMALSEGSTEHGGYHEALIGLGLCLGPASGAVGAWLYPGQTFFSAIAVGLVVGASLVLATTVAVRSKPSSNVR